MLASATNMRRSPIDRSEQVRKALLRALGVGFLASAALSFPHSTIGAPMGIAVVGDSWESPALQRCALNAYRPTFKGKHKGKRRPFNPRWGGPQPDPPGRR